MSYDRDMPDYTRNWGDTTHYLPYDELECASHDYPDPSQDTRMRCEFEAMEERAFLDRRIREQAAAGYAGRRAMAQPAPEWPEVKANRERAEVREYEGTFGAATLSDILAYDYEDVLTPQVLALAPRSDPEKVDYYRRRLSTWGDPEVDRKNYVHDVALKGYRNMLASWPIIDTRRLGVPPETVFSPYDALYCHEFLSVASRLGYPESEPRVFLSHDIEPDVFRRENGTSGELFRKSGAHVGIIRTSVKASSRGVMTVGSISMDELVYPGPGHGVAQQHLEDFMEAEKQRLAEGWKHPEELPLHTYRVQALNTQFSYYLCSDGLLRLGVGDRSLFPPPPQTGVWNSPESYSRRDSESLHWPDLSVSILDGRDVPMLYVPPKQYMADIIGRGLRANNAHLASSGYVRPTQKETRAKWEYRQA